LKVAASTTKLNFLRWQKILVTGFLNYTNNDCTLFTAAASLFNTQNHSNAGVDDVCASQCMLDHSAAELAAPCCDDVELAAPLAAAAAPDTGLLERSDPHFAPHFSRTRLSAGHQHLVV